MNKRAIAILGAIFILIVATLGFLIYQKSKKPSTPTNTNTNTAPVVESPSVPVTPTQPATAAVRLTDAGDPVVSPILFYQGNGISYFDTQGHLYQTDLTITNGSALLSNKKELSISLKSNISKILWPQAGNNFIAEFNSATKPMWSVYQTDKAAYTDIPVQVSSIDWLPTGDKVGFVWVDANGKATMNIGNPDTSGYKTLFEFYEPDDVISISPDGQHIMFYRRQNTDLTKNTINMASIDGKTFASVVKDGYNTGVLWSPDSKKFLFNKRDSSSQNYSLWVGDITTGETHSLGVNTLVSKAVWDKDGFTVYAGVPTSGTPGQGLTQDNLMKINISTSESKQFEPGLTIDAESLFLSTDSSILFFRNAQDSALYYIPVQ